MPRRSLRSVLGSLFTGFALLAAPAAAPAAAAPASADPAPPSRAAELAAALRAVPEKGSRTYASRLAQLLTEHSDSPEALAAAHAHVDVLRQTWLRSHHNPLKPEDFAVVTDSPVYRRQDAAELRRSIAMLQAEYALWEVGWRHLEDGRRGVEDAFARCGEAFLALAHRLQRDDPRAPAAWWYAAECFAAAGRWPDAADAYTRIVVEHPDAEESERSLLHLTYGHFAVARYDLGARWAEYFAKLYPSARRYVPDFLERAALARVGLKQPARALALFRRLVTWHEEGNPELAARYFWELRDLLPDDDAVQREHAETYLQRFGRRGGLGRRLVAEARLGELTWRRSCPQGHTHGLCIVPDARPGGTCAERRMRPLVVLPRVAADVERAHKLFAALARAARRPLRELEIPEDDLEQLAAFTDAVGLSAVYEVDREFEALLADLARLTALPADDPAPDLLARIERQASALDRRYAQLTSDGPREPPASEFERRPTPPPSDSDVVAIMAAARRGQLADLWAAAELLRKIPREIDVSTTRDYCDQRRRRVAPLQARARDAYAQCLARSQARATFTEFSRLCEAALGDLDPGRVPPLAELFGGDTTAPSEPRSVGVVLDAPPQPPAPTPAPAPAPVAYPDLGPPDRDADGVPDVDDRCPDVPEDRDGRDDGDGCPDVDDDGDGIPDAHEWLGERWSSCDLQLHPTGPRDCSLKPEDRDGVADHDGCPDVEETCTTMRFVPLLLDPNPLRIAPDELSSLDDVAAHLRARPTDTIVVTAHVEPRDRRIARKAAAAVRDELVRLGVPAEQIRIAAHADAAPREQRTYTLQSPRVELAAIGPCPEPSAPLPMLCL